MEEWRIVQQKAYEQRLAEKEQIKQQAAVEHRRKLKEQFEEQQLRSEKEQLLREEQSTQERLTREQQFDTVNQRIMDDLKRTNQERQERLREAQESLKQLTAQEQRVWIGSDGREFRSPVERDFWNAWLESGKQEIIPLIPQFPIGKYRVDFAHQGTLTAIEIDGYKHHSNRRAFVHDRIRERWLEKQGWHIIRFSASEISSSVSEHIEEVYEIIVGRGIPW